MASDGETSHVTFTGRIRLSHLAAEKLLDSMQHSVKRMDAYIADEVSKVDPETEAGCTAPPDTSQSMSSGQDGDVESVGSRPATRLLEAHSSVPTVCPVNLRVVRKAATDMIEARNYIRRTLTHEAYPVLMKHVIARAVNEKPIHLVRLAICNRVDALDFRSLDVWRGTCMRYEILPIGNKDMTSASETLTPPLPVPSTDNKSSVSILTSVGSQKGERKAPKKMVTSAYELFTPPNEFDWFSRDKMGKILSMPEACELFSIINMADCSENLKELYLNATRSNYFPPLVAGLATVGETIGNLRNLTRFVVRGMCDDEMLKIIGRNLSHLEHLDVSGSQFVTDAGLQNLFFQDTTKNSALYLVGSWIAKNLQEMNPCVNSLVYLDYSWTSVTGLGRKMVQLLPGSYLLKRFMSSRGENDSYGHHIFIREAPCFSELLSGVLDNKKKAYEKPLAKLVGTRGLKDFLALIEHHPWKNFQLNVFSRQIPKGPNSEARTSKGGQNGSRTYVFWKTYIGIITPNESERRIQGILQWKNGFLTHLYSIYPININNLGMLTSLQLFHGVVNDVWKLETSMLQKLVQSDVFAESKTFLSILESCPNLRRLRARIRGRITDAHLVKAIEGAMCKRCLEDFWIAPGVPGQPFQRNKDDGLLLGNGGQNSDTAITDNDLIMLSMECVGAMICNCPKLKRIGDVSTWKLVDAEELYVFCEVLKKDNPQVLIIWANMNLPDYTK